MSEFDEFLKSHVAEEISYFDRGLELKRGETPSIAENLKPRISYDLLIHREHDEYCFTNKIMDSSDFHMYFEKMIEVTKTPMCDLIDGKTKIDFKTYPYPNKELKDLFFKKIGGRKRLEALPILGRIGLYNSPNEDGKAPRIFFAIGHLSTIHILACDPYHNVYNGK